MIKAYPINALGERIGEARNFSDKHWNKMSNTHGKKLRFVEVKDGAPTTQKEQTVELISTKGAKRNPKHEK